jgi:hypothetical protein
VETNQAEAMAHGPVPMGQVVWTGPGKLAARKSHAVAALDGAICIQRAVLRTLFEAERRGYRSIRFRHSGTGVGGVPHGLERAALARGDPDVAAFRAAGVPLDRIALPTPAAGIVDAGLIASMSTHSS